MPPDLDPAAGEPATRRPMSAGREWLALPNLLSLSRIALAPVFLWLLTRGRPGAAFAVFLFAGLTDVLDGMAARLFRLSTRTGLWLDPMADKLLLTTAAVALVIPSLAVPNRLPLALFAVMIGRDAVIGVGAAIILTFRGKTDFPPTLLGKTSTVLQVLTILAVLYLNSRGAVSPLLRWLFDGTALATLLSGIQYVGIGIRKFNRRPGAAGSGGIAQRPAPRP